MSSHLELNQTPTETSPVSQLFDRVKSDILAEDSRGFLFYDSIEPQIGFHVALALDEDGDIE